MKKSTSFILFSFLMSSWYANAQISITSSDIAVPGRIIFQANDTLPTISAGSAGDNQTWDFSAALKANTIDTLTFQDPFYAENNIDFSFANLVIPVNITGDLSYAINSPSDLSIIGKTEQRVLYVGGVVTTIVKTVRPPEKVMDFPSTYNSTFVNDYKAYTQYFYGSVARDCGSCGVTDSIRQNTAVTKTVLVDAWGTLITNAGTYDVLRFKETRLTHDSVDGRDASLHAWFHLTNTFDSTTTYEWYANGVGVPLVIATMDSLGTVGNVKWLAAPPVTLGIHDASFSSAVNAYPNPAQNEINFNADPKVISIQLFDVTGRMINSYPAAAKTMINTSGLANGLYTYALISKDNTILSRGKFTIAK